MVYKVRIKKLILTSVIILFVFISVSQIQTSIANGDNGEDEEDDEDEDFTKDFAYASIGLFVVSGITIIIYFTNRFSRKLLKREGKPQETKEWISSTFRKIRKSLNYIHYLVGFGALTVLFIHGIYLSGKDESLVAIGWVTAAFYIFYVISGLVIWLKIKPFWNFKNAMKILNKIHRSVLLFSVIILIHIIHVIIAD
jgi:hypothetical protein